MPAFRLRSDFAPIADRLRLRPYRAKSWVVACFDYRSPWGRGRFASASRIRRPQRRPGLCAPRHPGAPAGERETRKLGQACRTDLAACRAQIFIGSTSSARRWLIVRRGAHRQARNNHSTSFFPRRVQVFRRPHQYRLDRLEELFWAGACARPPARPSGERPGIPAGVP